MKQSMIVLRVAGEGGYLVLVAQQAEDGVIRYQRGTLDQSGLFLSPEEGFPAIRKASEWVDSWEGALGLLDRYPWPMLGVLEVHPDYRARVLAAVVQRFEKNADTWRPDKLRRWREYCDDKA